MYVGEGPRYGTLSKEEEDKAKEAKTPIPDSFSKEGATHASSSRAETNDPLCRGVIRMVVGGPTGGDSHHARKAQSGKDMISRNWYRKHFKNAFLEPKAEKSFSEARANTPILFREAYDQMQLWDIPLEKVNTSLYGFAGEVVHPQGMMISLPLTLGTGTPRKTCMLKFLVVDVSSVYNAIPGRPTLNAFEAVISTYHMKIKFSGRGGMGEVQGDPLKSRRCYIEAVHKEKKKEVPRRRTRRPPPTNEEREFNKKRNPRRGGGIPQGPASIRIVEY
ncbi:UNVERIFIED_CONTAM: hypothetical protein Scaly_2897700 [Sesamum calycinum]|uniref:Uncharacterized protein n=1 Tax=Sesamum calycinum TaxID=2727403 RepID=A0AAW2L7F1_9LAMI